MTESTIEELCGEYPDDFISIDVLSNPNFTFENDPNYESVTLFDIEENAATVNSFMECELCIWWMELHSLRRGFRVFLAVIFNCYISNWNCLSYIYL